jgi:cytosine/uracil/thiamine/allantoin permease
MRFILPAMLLIVGIIHLLPLSGVLSAHRLQILYGIVIEDPNFEILPHWWRVLSAWFRFSFWLLLLEVSTNKSIES